MKAIRVGSRESRLAVAQAEEVIARLGVPCELVTMKTTGDKILTARWTRWAARGCSSGSLTVRWRRAGLSWRYTA